MRMTEALFDQILERMVAGEPISKILPTVGIHKAMVFYRWLDEAPNRAQTYARAQTAKAEAFAEECVEIADNDDAAKARNKIQARQWYASKINPRKYGDRMDLNIEQRIDVGGALIEARRRSALPISNLAQLAQSQALEYTEYEDGSATDNESAAPAVLPNGMPNPFD